MPPASLTSDATLSPPGDPRDAALHGRRATALLVLITALGFFIRLYHLGNRGFWGDELNVWYSCFSTYRSTGTGPLPPLIHGGLMRLMQSATSLTFRLPALAFGTLFIPVMAVLTESLADRRAGLFAAFLTALSPSAIFFAQEARPYSLMHLLCALTYLGLVKGYRDGNKWYGALYFFSLVLGFLNHALTTHVAAGLGLFFLIMAGTRRFRDFRTNVYLVLSGASFVGLVWLHYRWKPLQDLGGIYQLPFQGFVRSVLYCLGPVMHRSDGRAAPLFDLISLGYFVFVVAGWRELRKTNSLLTWAFVCLFGLSLTVLYCSLGVRATWWWGRYLSHLLPLYIALAAIGLSTPRFRGRLTFIPVLAAVVVLAPGIADWKNVEVYNHSNRFIGEAALVTKNEKKLDGVVLLFSTNSDPRWDQVGYDLVRTDHLPTYSTGGNKNLTVLQPLIWADGLPTISPYGPSTTEDMRPGRYALLATTQQWNFVASCSSLEGIPNIKRCQPVETLSDGRNAIVVVDINGPS